MLIKYLCNHVFNAALHAIFFKSIPMKFSQSKVSVTSKSTNGKLSVVHFVEIELISYLTTQLKLDVHGMLTFQKAKPFFIDSIRFDLNNTSFVVGNGNAINAIILYTIL